MNATQVPAKHRGRPRRRWAGVGWSAWTVVLPEQAPWWHRRLVAYAGMNPGRLTAAVWALVAVQICAVLLTVVIGWVGCISAVLHLGALALCALSVVTAGMVRGDRWCVHLVRAVCRGRVVPPVRVHGETFVHSAGAADVLAEHDPGVVEVLGHVLWDAGQDRLTSIGAACCPVHGHDAARTDTAWREWTVLARRAFAIGWPR
ncbi:hypothetical protein [Cellulomonas sp. RIT-PI-Y]|uniref:hypothetical protein n=1 Tax=Cellulomonas sp. RIT-PI-Y TaxID=3035297 RepID=UPI0021DA0DFF|nr:hypothetical protein [Cellulomonas sp. RIT-PI-Y]